jgi:hypothetical protein
MQQRSCDFLPLQRPAMSLLASRSEGLTGSSAAPALRPRQALELALAGVTAKHEERPPRTSSPRLPKDKPVQERRTRSLARTRSSAA